MDRLVYTAMSGASRTLLMQRQHTSNLANVNTLGYRADFATAVAKQVEGDGWQSRVMAGVGESFVDTRTGTLEFTGGELDVALNTEGWFAVEDANGQEAYTRAGNFHVDADGRLVNRHGLQVMGADGPIDIPEYDKLVIGENGMISIVGQGDEDTNLVELAQLKLVNPQDLMVKGPDSLFRPRNPDAGIPDHDENIQVASGYLESSNVQPMMEMSSYMSLTRQFELQLKVMRAADDIAQAGDALLRD
ncbi:flagellar basal body rod protein FlgF [Endozoicomonadaceae bacterium StTr2]